MNWKQEKTIYLGERFKLIVCWTVGYSAEGCIGQPLLNIKIKSGYHTEIMLSGDSTQMM